MRRFLSLIVLFAVVGASCGGSAGVAATVNGATVSVSDVESLIPGGADAIDETRFAELLFNLIVDKVIEGEAGSSFAITVSDEEFETERTSIINQITAQGQTLEEILTANDVTEDFLDVVVKQQILVTELQDQLIDEAGPPTQEEIELEFEAQRPQLTNVCSSHILLESEADAQAALDRALAGEDFAELAMELSTGPSGPNGGDLGCGSPDQFVVEFADATRTADIGVPIGPVETQFGFHVILVSERTEPDFQESRDSLVATIDQRRRVELFNEWRTDVLVAADVEVEDRYGTWVTDPVPSVLPPGV